MCNDKIQKVITDNLESKELNIADNVMYLASQGYLVNRNKINKISWIIMLIHAYSNINIFSEEQQKNLEVICNKVL